MGVCTVKRRAYIALTVIDAVLLAANVAAIISGHRGRLTVVAIVGLSVGVLSGLAYLHSTRGQS